jgi:hypothetical protein
LRFRKVAGGLSDDLKNADHRSSGFRQDYRIDKTHLLILPVRNPESLVHPVKVCDLKVM